VDSGTYPLSDDLPPDLPGNAPTDGEPAVPGAAPAGPDRQPAESGDAITAQEVRFAVAMSGGVSLAVWMGGVAREMNLLQEASNRRQSRNLPVTADGSGSGSAGAGADIRRAGNGRPGAGDAPDRDAQCRDLYQSLLKLLNVTVTMDVLSGTSAGGINAALLGLSSAAGVDLGGLRDLWLRTGSMDTLLRDPRDKAPPSLMQGDKVLFTQLDNGIRDLYESRTSEYRFPSADSGTAPPSTSVFITTTMMSGETSRFTDDYGTLVPDVDHHGLFTFDEQALGAGAGAPALTELALAARSSASFPGAFEPSFVPINAQIADGAGVPKRPNMAEFANMTRSHWVADGGLLANRPLTPLLAKVFSQPATGQVRRVLAFVVPDGGGTTRTAPQAVGGDDWEHPLTMAGALKADLGAQQSQSIASDLQAARAHNERIDARHGLRRSLADLGARLRSEDQQPAGSPPSDGLVDGRLLDEFERQQGSGLAQPLLTEVMRQLTTMQIPDAWAGQLAPGHQAETQMATTMVHILGRGWHEAQPPGGGPSAPADTAPSPADEEVAAWAAWTAATDPVGRAAVFGLPVFRAARALVIHLIRRGYERATDRGLRNKLAGHRAAIKDLSALLPLGWTGEPGIVRTYLDQAKAPDTDGHYRDLQAVVADLAEQKRQALLIGEGAADLRDAWAGLARVMQSLLADLPPLSAADGRASRADAAKAIGVYQRYFGQAPGPAQLADLLLKLVLAERALLPADAELDQPVEFVQFSANTRTLLAPAHDSAPAPQRLDSVNKLRGVEFHHFAAFYKSSWRAWDWMWGRLDGSGWLVHILLDPRRILAVVEDDPEAFPEGQRAASFAKVLRDATGLPAGLPEDCLNEDLAFLDDHTAEIPVSLPNSALFLAQAWQNLIAANELPAIADQILADNGHPPTPVGPRERQRSGIPPNAGQHRPQDRWVTTVNNLRDQAAAPEDFARQLPSCPVRQETLAGELRTPAFTQLATKTAAVATAALTSAPETPGAIRPVLTTARTVTRTGYMAAKVTGGTAWKILVAGAVLALVGGVLATQGMMVVGLTGTIVALVGLYLIVLGAWELRRGVLGALLAVTVVALLASLTLHWMRFELWGTGKNINSGLLPRDVLPWLSSTWWGGLAILGGVVLIGVLLSRIPRARPPGNRAIQTPVPPPADVTARSPASAAAPAPPEETIPAQTPVPS
jgi:patatin-related protein